MSRRPDAGALLERALIESAARSAVSLTIESLGSRAWASATFSGARHTLTLRAARSLDTDSWIGELEEAELSVRGHLVADVAVTTIERSGGDVLAHVEVLTLEDG
ncbi:hypothetical protein [Sphingomonas sp. RS2018]